MDVITQDQFCQLAGITYNQLRELLRTRLIARHIGASGSAGLNPADVDTVKTALKMPGISGVSLAAWLRIMKAGQVKIEKGKAIITLKI